MTTAPAVKAALAASLAASLSGVTIRRRFPTQEGQTGNDLVVVDKARATQETRGMAGQRSEDVTINVAVLVFRAGGDSAGDIAEARGYEMLAAVEAALSADPTLGGAVEPSVEVTSYDEKTTPYVEGYECRIDVEVVATAFIHP